MVGYYAGLIVCLICSLLFRSTLTVSIGVLVFCCGGSYCAPMEPSFRLRRPQARTPMRPSRYHCLEPPFWPFPFFHGAYPQVCSARILGIAHSNWLSLAVVCMVCLMGTLVS